MGPKQTNNHKPEHRFRKDSVFIIAEAGVNHNGSFEIAKKLVDVAAEAGANAIKFQTFDATKVASRAAEKADYQKMETFKNESQLDMLKKLELSKPDHLKLINYCKQKNIMFMSTAFDLDSVEFLKNLKLSVYKIPSGEITNLPYLEEMAKINGKLIVSTGMSNFLEIKNALNILLKNGMKKNRITLLHCNTEYPTPYEDVNLHAMVSIKNKFKTNVGYSDHTKGIEVAIAAVALGATVIEKHFTLDRTMDGPDHKASLEPHELRQMVQAIRNIERSLGSSTKKASKSEKKNISIARKSIVAARNIRAGEKLTAKNMTTKRPGNGISPMKWYKVLNKTAKKNFKEDDLIEI